MVRRIVRILLRLAAFAVGGFVVLVLIGLWTRYEQTTAATTLEAKHSQQARSLREGGKLVGTGAVENANHGMSVAVSADGHTVVVGGPGPNNVDRDRSPLVGPAGAAWAFTLRRGKWTE